MTARRLLVDGMNVIGSKPDGWWRDRPGAMRALTERLEAHAADTGDEVTVVFDGRPFEIDAGERVRVMFASRRGPNAADDDIADLVAGDDAPETLTVVTSDSDLADRVTERGAEVVPAGRFRRELG
ncbi:MAG: NYN domain-containing protein [Thermoleophilaceae bacterium]